MKITVTMTNGETYTTGLSLIDQVAFERKFRHDAAVGNAEESPLTFAAYAAWHALHREGTITMTWDEFLPQAAQVGTEDDSDPFPDTPGN